MIKIDDKKMWESIIGFKMSEEESRDLMEVQPLQAAVYVMGKCFKNALNEQGLEYKDGKIVRIATSIPDIVDEHFHEMLDNEPKFKVGDVIRHKVHGDKYRYTVHMVGKDFYAVDNDLIITFNMADNWELVEPDVSETDFGKKDDLTEFEQCLKSGTNCYVEQGRNMEDWDAKQDAKELLEIARRSIH